MTKPTKAERKAQNASLAMSNKARLGVTAALVAAFGLFALAFMRTETSDDPVAQFSGVEDDGAEFTSGELGVERFIPPGGTDVLGQQAIGLDLEPGWSAELTFLPANGPAVPLPEEVLEITPELALYLYVPGSRDGEVDDPLIERLPGGENCAQAVIWDQVRGRAASERTVEWCFSVV